jgi:adenosylhomocysteinase
MFIPRDAYRPGDFRRFVAPNAKDPHAMSLNASPVAAAWVETHMPRVRRAVVALPELTGVRLAMSMHLDLKMLPLVSGLLRRGAKLFIVTCNPSTVRDEVVAKMRAAGARVGAWKNMPEDAYRAAIVAALQWRPTHLCEMGADLTHAICQGEAAAPSVRASLEATGSGVNRLRGLVAPYPIFNWDDVPVKEGLHNRHLVGLTTWHTFFARTLLTLHEKRVLIVGYGSVGQGLAASARAFGGEVAVAERDPSRRLQARYDGWESGAVEKLAPRADVICTATGAPRVLPWPAIERLRDGCFLLNAGHRADEIEIDPLFALPTSAPIPQVTAHFLPSGATVYLLARGAMANLTAGDGDSLNCFDLTLAVMTAGIGHIVGGGSAAAPGVHLLPREVWEAAI